LSVQKNYGGELNSEHLEAVGTLIEEYCRFWEILDGRLVEGHELHYDNNSWRGDVREATAKKLVILFEGQRHLYTRAEQQGVFAVTKVIDTATNGRDVLVLLRGLEGEFDAWPGNYELWRGAFWLGEGNEMEAKEALELAIDKVRSSGNISVRAGLVTQKARMLLRLIPPSSLSVDSIARY